MKFAKYFRRMQGDPETEERGARGHLQGAPSPSGGVEDSGVVAEALVPAAAVAPEHHYRVRGPIQREGLGHRPQPPVPGGRGLEAERVGGVAWELRGSHGGAARGRGSCEKTVDGGGEPSGCVMAPCGVDVGILI